MGHLCRVHIRNQPIACDGTAAIVVDGVASGSLAGTGPLLDHQKAPGWERSTASDPGDGLRLGGLRGVALGQFLDFEDIADDPRDWPTVMAPHMVRRLHTCAKALLSFAIEVCPCATEVCPPVTGTGESGREP